MSESFDYNAGTMFPTTGGTPNGGFGWNATGDGAANTAGWGTGVQNNGDAAGTNRTATSGGLTYSAPGYAPATGNKLTLDSTTPNASQSMSRLLGGQNIDSGTTYFSALLRRENDTLRTMNLAFFSTTGSTAEKLTIGQIGATVSGSLQGSNGKVALIYTNSNPGGVRASTVDMGTGVTHLMILKIEWNQSGTFEKVSAWVDPADVTSEGAAGAPFYSNAEFDLVSLNFLRPFTGNAAAGPPAAVASTASYDELRLGGTWESVTSLVPEPSSFALLALGGLVLGAFRKR
jgi:hypothetical protein